MLPRQKRGTSSNEKHIKCFNGTLQTPNSDVGRPSVTINGKARDVRVDDDPSFKCDVYANPAATITWQFNGTKLDRKRVEHSIDACGQTLSLKDVSVENSGTYTCVVENLYGKGTASAKLNVGEFFLEVRSSNEHYNSPCNINAHLIEDVIALTLSLSRLSFEVSVWLMLTIFYISFSKKFF